MKQFWLLLILNFSLAAISIAQDKHFTQFYATPMNLNPALAGGFDGTYRFSFIYRDQWRQVMESPFTSFGAAIDLRFPVGISRTSKDAIGVGLMFDTDRVSTLGYSNTGINFFGAFHKSLNSRNNQFLSFGLQLAINQRNINVSRLTFEDQFDGSNGYTVPTNDILPTENTFGYSDISTGINYSYSPSRKVAIFAGAAMHHILQPQISYFFDRRQDNGELGSDQLLRRYTGHLSARFPISNKLSLMPRAVVSLQGPHLEINAGSNVRINLGEYGGSAMHIGGWVRPVTNEVNAINLEAAILIVGFEVDNVLFGLSYDLSLSDIQTSRAGQGAFEFSIAYLGNYDNETILCPKF